ncbi:MAG: tetratricopeptide repeat protein [Chloroflexota bacterium]
MSDNTPHEAITRDPKLLPVTLPGKLIGREAELAQVYGQLKEGGVVLLHGPAGVGKTALAATLAMAYAQQPGGVLWMNVSNPRLEELLIRVGRAYNIEEITNSDTPLGMVGAVENTLRSNKPFIVIEGPVSADIAGRFVTRCVTGVPTLITNSTSLEGPWTEVALAPLDADQAAALFRREGRVAVNQYEVDTYGIVKQVGTLPLGLIVAARAMLASKQTPETFLKPLQQITRNIEPGPTVALTASFRALNGALQGLVLMMGAMFNSGASGELLSMVSGAPLDSVQQAMNILTQLHLVERTQRYGEYYYTMHPLTYAFAESQLRSADKLDVLRTKVRDSVMAYARKYSTDSQPNTGHRLAMEMDTFMALARWAAENEQRQVTVELANHLSGTGDFTRERGYAYEVMRMRELGSGRPSPFPAYPAEEAAPGPPEEEFDLFEEAEAESEYAVDEDALEEVEDLEEAEAISPEDMFAMPRLSQPEDLVSSDTSQLRTMLGQERHSGNVDQQITILKAIGQRQVGDGMENEALAAYDELLELYEENDDQQGILETLEALSGLMVTTNNSQAAVMHASRGVKLAQELDMPEARLRLEITLGDARQQLGESEEAMRAYSEALAIARSRGNAENEAIALYKLGFAQLDDGSPHEAIDNFEQALRLFKKQDKRAHEGRVMGGLGSAYGDLERWSEAVSFHTSALYIAREVDDPEEEALQLSSLAYAALKANQLAEAVLRYRQALHLAFETGNKDNIVSTLVDLARLLLRSRSHVNIAGMLVDTAAEYEPNDRDVIQLEQQVAQERQLAEAQGTQLKPVKGDAVVYAANAYALLEE